MKSAREREKDLRVGRRALRSAVAAVNLAQPPRPLSTFRALAAVAELTVGHSKLVDHVSRSRFARIAGLSDRSATRALADLVRLGVIEWEPAKARNQFGRLRILDPETDSWPALSLETRATWVARVLKKPEPNGDGTRDNSEHNASHLGGSQPGVDQASTFLREKADPKCELCGGSGVKVNPSGGLSEEPFEIACDCTQPKPPPDFMADFGMAATVEATV